MALALLLADAASAARLALVIGNDQYANIERLKNAKNDAKLIAGFLKKAGFEVTQANDLGRNQIWSALDTFKGRINKGDEVVFYFAGHGVQIGSNQLLLPTDIEAKGESQVQRDGVSLVDVQDALKDARVAVMLVDACRDNPFPKQGTRSVGATRGLVPPEPSTGQIIMMSAGRNQKALDSVPGQNTGNGLFTWELVQLLQTPGLEVRTALEQVKDRVDDKARRANHEQRPSVVSDLRGNFFFIAPGANVTIQVAPPAAAEPASTSASQIEQQAWEAAQRANVRAGYDAYLAEYPKGRFASAARVALALVAPQAVESPAEAAVTTSEPSTVAPQASLALIDARYQVMGDGSEIKDTQTGLIWQRCSVGQRWTGSSCEGQQKLFTFGGAQKLAKDGWRVPSLRELTGLVYCSSGITNYLVDPKDGGEAIKNGCFGKFQTPTIARTFFPDASGGYWSSTSYVGDWIIEWIVSFGDGALYRNNSWEKNAVRLVRAS